MIAIIEGEVVSRGTDEVVVMTAGGVGYRLTVSLTTLAGVPPSGEPVRLHVHTHVRDDALQLFGFEETEEREAFLLLTSVSGVGPRLAVSLLSAISVAELAQAVRIADIKRLTAAQGVGKKMAERIALELKEKLGALGSATSLPPVARARPGTVDVMDDVRSALSNLGYRAGDVEQIMRRLEAETSRSGPPPALETLVRRALRLAR